VTIRLFVICRLGLIHTKFEVFTITCNVDMKGNTKRKNLSHPLGDLGGNAQG